MKHIDFNRFTGSIRFWQWLNLAVWMGIFLPGMLFAQQQTFTSNTTFVVPPGVTRLTVECWGGGGAGGQSTGTSETGGGGGGAYARRNSLVVTPGETLNVFVGQGGLVGGTAGKGGDTYLSRNITPLVVAIGGNNGSRNSQNGA
ncbi:MAG: glycine-rich domain-containing protein, partial [Bacteroidota bacterium]